MGVCCHVHVQVDASLENEILETRVVKRILRKFTQSMEAELQRRHMRANHVQRLPDHLNRAKSDSKHAPQNAHQKRKRESVTVPADREQT